MAERLRPHLAWSGRTADLLRERLWLDAEAGTLVASDGHGRRHRLAIGPGPGQAARLAFVDRHTVERGLYWLAVLDGTGRPLAYSEGSIWTVRDAQSFAGRAGLEFDQIHFPDFASFDAWLDGARPRRLDEAPGHRWPLIGIGLGVAVGIALAVVAPGPAVAWLLAWPVLGFVVVLVADRLGGERR